LQGAEAVAVNVQARHVGDGKGPKERQTVTERRADNSVDVLRCGDALLDEVDGFLKQDILQSVEHEAGFVVDPGGQLACQGYECLDCLYDVFVGAGVRN
jgi:hypothetical protein